MSEPARPALTPEGFAQRTGVSRETLARLIAYERLLRAWQSRINLVGASSMDDLWHRHMLDSAQLAPHVPADSRVLLDIGSGAGFPGLVLAILLGRETHLVESDSRKCAFLREAARITGTVVQIHRARIERLDPFPADVITARAVAALPILLDYAAPFLTAPPAAPTLCLFAKTRAALEEELTAAQKLWHMYVDIADSGTDSSGVIVRLWGLARERSG